MLWPGSYAEFVAHRRYKWAVTGGLPGAYLSNGTAKFTYAPAACLLRSSRPLACSPHLSLDQPAQCSSWQHGCQPYNSRTARRAACRFNLLNQRDDVVFAFFK